MIYIAISLRGVRKNEKDRESFSILYNTTLSFLFILLILSLFLFLIFCVCVDKEVFALKSPVELVDGLRLPCVSSLPFCVTLLMVLDCVFVSIIILYVLQVYRQE